MAIALKGEELPLHHHSYHDLADVARTLKLEVELHRVQEAERNASTNQPVQAKAMTDDLYILSANEEAMEEAIQRFNGSSAGEALKAVFAAQKSLRALLASQLWADMSTCKHVFMAVPINDSRAANVPAKAVCKHCGYEPEPQADGEVK